MSLARCAIHSCPLDGAPVVVDFSTKLTATLCRHHAYLFGMSTEVAERDAERRQARRDMFAAAAIPMAWAYCEESFHRFTKGTIAREAWGIADAMIETENDDDGDTKAANAAAEEPKAGAGGGS